MMENLCEDIILKINIDYDVKLPEIVFHHAAKLKYPHQSTLSVKRNLSLLQGDAH